MLYAVSANDFVCSPELILPNYEENSSEKKVWASLPDSGHEEIALTTQRWSYATINMFDCHLKNDEIACSTIYQA
jgi:hypothetical protein